MTPEWKRGWPVVVAVAAAIASGGALWGFVSSLFIEGITKEFGWTRGDLALVSSFAGLGAISAPFIGWATDRFGVKLVAALGTLALAAMYIGLTFAQTKLHFQLLAIGVGAFITASGALVLARPVIQWFDRSRGLALGLATVGGSVAGIGAPILVQAMVAEYGWRAGYYALAFSAAFICVPIVLLFVRERPGASHHVDLDALELPDSAPPDPAAPKLKWLDVVKRPVFWALAVALMAVNAAGAGILGQMAVLLQDKGISAELAAAGISVYAAAIIVGRVGCGYLLDRFPPEAVACIFTTIPALGCAALIAPELTFAFAAVAVAMAGLQQGSETDVMAYFISRIFGAASFSLVFGMVITAGIIGTVSGGLIFGYAHDFTKSYDIALLFSTVLFLGAAGLLLSVGPLKRTVA